MFFRYSGTKIILQNALLVLQYKNESLQHAGYPAKRLKEKKVTQLALYRLWILPAAAGLLILGCLFQMAKEENIKKLETISRNRYFGMSAGWFALIWCIPHAQAVAPGFLLPLLWPLALIVPAASFFCLDHMTARAVGGLLIIFSYEALHRSFELALPTSGVIAVFSWFLGACGIWISGIPYHFRDALRLSAAKGKWKLLFTAACWIAALLFTISGVFAV